MNASRNDEMAEVWVEDFKTLFRRKFRYFTIFPSNGDPKILRVTPNICRCVFFMM